MSQVRILSPRPVSPISAAGACSPPCTVANMRRAEEHPPPVSVAWEGGGATNMVSPSASQQGEGVMADTIARTDTHRLIPSNKVEANAVDILENENTGKILKAMNDKGSGQTTAGRGGGKMGGRES